jgi:hypothetical protein
MLVSTLLRAERNNRLLDIRPLVDQACLDREKDEERQWKASSLRRCVLLWRLEVMRSRPKKDRARQSILFLLGTENLGGEKDKELIWSYVEEVRRKNHQINRRCNHDRGLALHIRRGQTATFSQRQQIDRQQGHLRAILYGTTVECFNVYSDIQVRPVSVATRFL